MNNKIEEFINIAKGELGYIEDKNNDTKYGKWYGLNYNPWCAMFISWCLNEINIDNDIMPKFASCTAGFNFLLKNNRAIRENIIPKRGDLIFFKWQNDGTPDHVGIVENVQGETIYTIEGNRNDKVARFIYNKNNSTIYGYGFLFTHVNNVEKDVDKIVDEIIKRKMGKRTDKKTKTKRGSVLIMSIYKTK